MLVFESEQVFLETFHRDFQRLADVKTPTITLCLTPVVAWSVMCQIQLATRHPENQGPTRDMAEEIARKLSQALSATPALAEMARRGWEPSFDEEVEHGPH